MNIDRKLNQTAVYWAKGALDRYAETSFAAPVEIQCRWQDGLDLVSNSAGENLLSIARVYVNGATTVIDEDDRLFLGLLTDLTLDQQANPNLEVGAKRVVLIGDSPSLDNVDKLRKVHLGK